MIGCCEGEVRDCCLKSYIADMPHDTDYPYPIRILAVF